LIITLIKGLLAGATLNIWRRNIGFKEIIAREKMKFHPGP